MNRVITIDNYKMRQYDLAENRRAEGDFVGAICTLKGILENEDKPCEVYRRIARVYMDVDMLHYSLEFWFKYLDVCPAKERYIAYNGLGACYYYLDEMRWAGYYFEKQLDKAPEEPCDYLDELLDYYDTIKEAVKPDFYISYPPEKVSSDRLIESAENAFLSTDEGEIDNLNLIKKDDENYVGAQLRLAAFNIIKNKLDLAEDIINRLIADFPDDKLPFINKLCFLSDTNRKKDFFKASKQLNRFDICQFAECYKLATAFMNMGDDKSAEVYIERALKEDKYSINANFLCGSVKYNLNKFDQALKCYTIVYQLTDNPVAKFYVSLAESKIKDEDAPRLSYEIRLPNNIVSEWVNKVTGILTGECKICEENMATILEMCEWVYSFPNSMQGKFCGKLICSGEPKLIGFFKQILLSPDISAHVKGQILYYFVITDYNKKLGIVDEGAYYKFKFEPFMYSINGKYGALKKAYALSVSKLATVCNVNIKGILKTTYLIKDLLNNNGNLKLVKDEKALACAIIVINGEEFSDDMYLLSKFFGTDKKKINSIIKLIKAKNVNS